MKSNPLFKFVPLAVMAFLVINSSGYAEEKKEEMVIMAYPVGDLFIKIEDYPYQGNNLPTSGSLNSKEGLNFFTPQPYPGGGAGGGFGGGEASGGYGGGAGGFQVQDPIGDGQYQIGSGIGQQTVQKHQSINPTGKFEINELINTIQTLISPASWEANGGQGTIVTLGSMLLIRQTKAAHQKVDQLLDVIRSNHSSQQMVSLEAYWVDLPNDYLNHLEKRQSTYPIKVDEGLIEEFFKGEQSERKGFSSRVTCFNGQTVSLNSGNRKMLVKSVLPTVGTNAIGYQPETISIHSGLVFQVKPQLEPGGKFAIVDIQSVITNSKEEDEKAEKKTDYVDSKDREFHLDQISLDVQQLSTTLRIPTGEFIVVGGMSPSEKVISSKSTMGDNLVLILRIHKNSEKGPGERPEKKAKREKPNPK